MESGFVGVDNSLVTHTYMYGRIDRETAATYTKANNNCLNKLKEVLEHCWTSTATASCKELHATHCMRQLCAAAADCPYTIPQTKSASPPSLAKSDTTRLARGSTGTQGTCWILYVSHGPSSVFAFGLVAGHCYLNSLQELERPQRLQSRRHDCLYTACNWKLNTGASGQPTDAYTCIYTSTLAQKFGLLSDYCHMFNSWRYCFCKLAIRCASNRPKS